MIQKLNATLQRANVENRKFDDVRVAKISVAPWLAALKFARQSFQSVGLAAPDVNLGPELRNGRQTYLQLEHQRELLTRYEIFPERVTSTSIFVNAAEKYEKQERASIESKFEMYNKGAQLVGALPDLHQSMICCGSEKASEHASDVAKVVFGPHPSADAVELAKVIVQASDFVHERGVKRQRVQSYQALMPGAVEDIQHQVQVLAEAGVLNLRDRVKTVQRSFEIVTEKATGLLKTCAKIESQWTLLSNEPFHLNKYQQLLLTINDLRPKLLDRKCTLEIELGKKIETRQKFIATCRSDFVPEAQLKEVLGDDLSMDWRAESVVREAALAVARVVEFVFLEAADKLGQSALEVDEDVRCVIAEILGEED